MHRRPALKALAALLAGAPLSGALGRTSPPAFMPVLRGRQLAFPRDHGAHPEARTEWWYLTGQVESSSGERMGVQVTFFRSATGLPASNPRWDASQIYFAHAALARPGNRRLVHAERRARGSRGLVQAGLDDADLMLVDWTLVRRGERWEARLRDRNLDLRLDFTPTQPVLLQGDKGFSQKAPDEKFASHYYSLPHLDVSGLVAQQGKSESVRGKAWLDHEWSSEVLMPGAVGWDWMGLNLDDGSALMVFRIRDPGGATLHAAGLWRQADGRERAFRTEDIRFTTRRTWRSAASGANYPVECSLQVGSETLLIQPLMDDQELDARASTGALYWEGAVTAYRAGQRIGEGYLELTGYAERLRF